MIWVKKFKKRERGSFNDMCDNRKYFLYICNWFYKRKEKREWYIYCFWKKYMLKIFKYGKMLIYIYKNIVKFKEEKNNKIINK